MKGKPNEMPVAKNFRIADHDKNEINRAGPGIVNGDAAVAAAGPAAGTTVRLAETVPDVQPATADEKPHDTKPDEGAPGVAAVAGETDTATAAAAAITAEADATVTTTSGVEGGDADRREQKNDEPDLEDEAAYISSRAERFEPAVNKVAADGGLAIVTYLKRNKFFNDVWRKLDEKQQANEIDGLYDLMKTLTYGSVNAVASRGFDYVEMALTSVKITIDKEGGRKVDVAGIVPYDQYFVIDSINNKTIMMVPRNTNQFLGGQKVKPDVIGTLRLPDPELPLGPPISGPGTPTSPAVMNAVGKGPEAAKTAVAAITQPSPSPAVHG